MEKENAKVKKTPKGLIIGIVAIVAIIIIGIAAWIVYSSSMGYVAKVSDQKVTKQQYMVISKFNISQFLSSVSDTTTDATKYDWNTKIDGETAKDQVVKNTLDNIQEIKIQIIKAKEAGIELNQDDLKAIDDDINKQVEQSGGRQQAEKAFKEAYGVSLSEYKQIYKELYLTSKYASTEYNKITVTDDEIKKYYDENKAEYDKVTASHILVATMDLTTRTAYTEGKQAEAKKKAEELLAKVKAGEDINKLAEENSDDKPSVTENKGRYTFGKGEMMSEFEEWCFTSKVGDVGLVKTDFGYHIIKLEKREETKFDDVKAKIKTSLTQEKYQADYTKKLEDWKKDAQYAIVKNEKALAKINETLYPAK